MTQDISIHPEAVNAYLQSHPQFFEDYRDLLTTIHLPSPHGSGAISLTERQQQLQRERIYNLESKLAELIAYGKENDDINERIHLLSLCLIASTDFDVLVDILVKSLQDDFKISEVTLCLWAKPEQAKDITHPAFENTDPSIKVWAETQQQPYCGNRPETNWRDLFKTDKELKSVAILPLRNNQTFGVLALASEDEHRFNENMGTVFLQRISDLVSAALIRYIQA